MEDNTPRRLKRFERQEAKEPAEPQFSRMRAREVAQKQKPVMPETKEQEQQPKQAAQEKKGFFAKLFGGGKKPAQKKQAVQNVQAAQADPGVQELQSTRQSKHEWEKGSDDEKKKIYEAIFRQLQEQKRSNAKKQSLGIAMNQVKSFKETHNRLPQGNEYNVIAENIYQQIKTQNTPPEQRKEQRQERQRGKKMPGQKAAEQNLAAQQTAQQQQQPAGQATQQQAQSEKKTQEIPDLNSIDIKDLLAGPEKEKEFKIEDFSSGSEEELKLGNIDDSVDSLSKDFETEKNICPNCKTKSEELVFCPDCGTGFCVHCAKGANTEAGITKYICPKCSREVKAQK